MPVIARIQKILRTSHYHIIISAFLTFFSMLLWLNPTFYRAIHNIDVWVFKLLNGSLSYNIYFAYCIALLNHSYEKLLNVIVMMAIQLIIISQLRTQHKLSKVIFYASFFWLYLQIGIYSQHLLFTKLFVAERYSPSLQIDNPVLLSELFGNSAIKDHSYSSFPSGHTFVTTCWLYFNLYFISKNRFGILFFTWVIFSMPRVFSGAHWFSDVLFSMIIAQFYIAIAIALDLPYRFYVILQNFLPIGRKSNQDSYSNLGPKPPINW